MRLCRLLSVLAVGACSVAPPTGDNAAPAPAESPGRQSFTVLAAGDIGQCSDAGPFLTARLLDRLDGSILAVGDLAYERGTAAEFRDCFDRSWGRHRSRLHPVPGNHDYASPGAAPYFRYFGPAAAAPGGYYSFDIATWHIVALNSNIDAAPGSPQERWLAQDLRRVPRDRCILAFFHHTYMTSGYHGRTRALDALVADLYRSGVSIVVTGHDHHYERFAALDSDGTPDQAHGARWFVAGTGGARLYPVPLRITGSEAAAAVWGVLGLELRDGGYAWEFVPAEPGAFRDAGSGRCVERRP